MSAQASGRVRDSNLLAGLKFSTGPRVQTFHCVSYCSNMSCVCHARVCRYAGIRVSLCLYRQGRACTCWRGIVHATTPTYRVWKRAIWRHHTCRFWCGQVRVHLRTSAKSTQGDVSLCWVLECLYLEGKFINKALSTTDCFQTQRVRLVNGDLIAWGWYLEHQASSSTLNLALAPLPWFPL